MFQAGSRLFLLLASLTAAHPSEFPLATSKISPGDGLLYSGSLKTRVKACFFTQMNRGAAGSRRSKEKFLAEISCASVFVGSPHGL